MGTLEKVIQLRKEGASEGDIINKLKIEGISPMEINDSLNQAKIKEAVEKKDPEEGMQPSIMGNEDSSESAPPPEETTQTQAQTPESISQGEYTPQSPEPAQYASQNPAYFPNTQGEDYGDEDYGDAQGEYAEGQDSYNNSTDTIIEIAEQVFSEKIKDLSKEIKALTEFKTIYSSRIDDLKERLIRMEKLFDTMQIKILEKVGSFGENIHSLKKEVNMIEDSFTKINKK